MAEKELKYIYETMNLEIPEHEVNVSEYRDEESLSEHNANERMGAALRVFIQSVLDSAATIDKIDKSVIDTQIAFIDQQISKQLDEVIHHPEFQKLESAWKSLKFTVDRTNFQKNIKIEMLNVSKQALMEDFEDSPETIQSGLFKHIYTSEYDTPGGEPITAIIANYEFTSTGQDIALLQDVSKVSASAHCPFIASVGGKFFGKNDVRDLPKIDDLENYMDRAEYLKWKGFRESEDSRYVGLTLPRFLLREPYGAGNSVKEFNYKENVTGTDHDKYLWGNASFAFATNMTSSFEQNGWCVQIRGPEAGGKVENLPIHNFDVGKGVQSKIPTEILIPETREFEFANQGFISLSYYKNSDFACFFSANSAQKPQQYDSAELTANMRINSRLPYLFLTSRLAHYLKVLQRENIGATKSAADLEGELNKWIKSLVTEMKDPDPKLAATHPLSAAQVKVTPNEDNPGFYSVSMAVRPHFQVEGLDVNLSLVSQMPQAK